MAAIVKIGAKWRAQVRKAGRKDVYKRQQGTLAMPVPQSLTVSQGYYFGYPQRSERSEALKLFETWLKSAAAAVAGR